MSAKKIARVVMLSLVGLFTLGLLGAYFYFSNLPPEGELVFMSPGEAAVIVVDGDERIELSDQAKRTLSLPAGTHSIEVLSPSPREFEVEVTDRKTTIVPVADPQCFATYDVTQSAYEGSDFPPRFVRSETLDAAFELPYATYTSLDELPKERSASQSVSLIVTGTCEEVAELTAMAE